MTGATPPPPVARPPIRRSRGDRWIAGVAGGLARHLGIDPIIVRIAVVALVFCASYIGQSISSGMEGQKAKILQWGCWFLATGAMLVTYLLTG